MLKKQEQRKRRHKRVRAKISGTIKIPRLCLFKSNQYIYAQLIDDENGKTLIVVSDLKEKKPKTAFEIGKMLADKALKKKIKKIVFDRGGYKYHGRVKALAEGAREGGLKF